MRECNNGTYCKTTEVETAGRTGLGLSRHAGYIGLRVSLNPRSTTLVTSRPIRSLGNLLIATGAAGRTGKERELMYERGEGIRTQAE